MKQIQYTGSSKLISRIVHLLNRKAPMPLDADGDAVWGTNGQVLTTDGNGNTSWTTPRVTHESVSVTADGVKTWVTLLNELFTLVTSSKVGEQIHLKIAYSADAYEVYCPVWINKGSEYMFSRTYFAGNTTNNYTITVSASSSFILNGVAPTGKPGSGTVIAIIY